METSHITKIYENLSSKCNSVTSPWWLCSKCAIWQSVLFYIEYNITIDKKPYLKNMFALCDYLRIRFDQFYATENLYFYISSESYNAPQRGSSSFYLSSTEHFSISSQLVALPFWFSLTALTSLVSNCDRMEQSTLCGKCFYKLIFFIQWTSPTQNDRLQTAQKMNNVFFWFQFI